LWLRGKGGQLNVLPWEVEMPGKKPRGVVVLVSLAMTEEVEDFFDKGMLGAPAKDLNVFSCVPAPPDGSVVLRVPSHSKKWCERG
jgi:hypothetical protein